jgi:CRP/FNR family transcriptional regulator, cyclic AMP receptor protein
MSDNKALLRRVTILSELSDKDLDTLSQRLVPRTYIKEAIIVSQEEEGDSLFIIKSGKVKVTLYGDSGREVILSIFQAGDYFGEMSLIDNQPRSANVIAIDESEVLILSRPAFSQQIEENPRVAQGIMRELCRRLRRADAAIGSLALLDVYGRLAHVLLDYSKREGTQTAAGVQINERPTQQDLANMVGTTRETVSRALSEFQRRGWIEMRGRALVLTPSFSLDDVRNRDD